MVVLCLIFSGVCVVGYFSYCELFLQEEPSVPLALLFCLSTFLGLWTMTAQLCVTCSDPGILTNHGRDSKDKEYRVQCLDLDIAEQEVFADDPIY